MGFPATTQSGETVNIVSTDLATNGDKLLTADDGTVYTNDVNQPHLLVPVASSEEAAVGEGDAVSEPVFVPAPGDVVEADGSVTGTPAPEPVEAPAEGPRPAYEYGPDGEILNPESGDLSVGDVVEAAVDVLQDALGVGENGGETASDDELAQSA